MDLQIKTVVFLLVVHCVIFIIAKKVIKIDKYEICARGENHPFKMHTMTLDYLPEIGFYIDVDCDLNRDVKGDDVELEFKITRCSNKEALDTCEKISPMKLPKICEILLVRNMAWDEILDRVEPPLRCPFKKARYIGRNMTFNPSAFQFFPLDGYYWKVKGSAYENKKLMASLCFDFQVIRG